MQRGRTWHRACDSNRGKLLHCAVATRWEPRSPSRALMMVEERPGEVLRPAVPARLERDRVDWHATCDVGPLTPAAEALAGNHPLAATLVLRAMIDFSLKNNRSSRYRHAARHLLDCSSLVSAIEDFGRFEPHEVYEARLRREHRRKSSFWSLVD